VRRPHRQKQRRSQAPSSAEETFRLTYATLADPPGEVHARLDAAIADIRHNLGEEHPMLIAGADARADGQFESRSPIDTDLLLGRFQDGTADDVDAAVRSALVASPAWARTPWPRRVDVLMRAAGILEASAFHLAAVAVFEIGKSRLEALTEVQQTADLIRWYCREMQDHHGFVRDLPKDPLAGFVSRNRSILKPYGVWGVIAPFNQPFLSGGGPIAAALIAGNGVVYKPATASSWCGWLLAQCLREAGVPPGVLNLVTGSGERVGDPLMRHPALAGITFGGTHDVGVKVMQAFAAHRHPRPCIAEMGGKNAVIVSRNADVERAALGIVRSAFALQGQHCAACSRVLVDRVLTDRLVDRMLAHVRELKVGNPLERATAVGPVISRSAYERYLRLSSELAIDGQLLHGGRTINEGDLLRGYFCEPTIAQLGTGHALWREELMLPILLISPVGGLEEALEVTNSVDYGLSAGFYGTREEAEWFLEYVQAGAAYCNRAQAATTGAWPGYQGVVGWKASGSTGKASGSAYYLQQYMREQSQTLVD
jgi:1-pyrroline-5-carboxylate dehydrogenase